MTNLEKTRLEGLTLRDQIALSFLSRFEFDDIGTIGDAAKELGIKVEEYNHQTHWPILAARKCYVYADAFLKEREINQYKIADDTEESPELWRDLEEGEVYQEGDRIFLSNKAWIAIHEDHPDIGRTRKMEHSLAQRRVRKDGL